MLRDQLNKGSVLKMNRSYNKDENIREEFSGALNNTVNGINRRDMLIIVGNMNAKIGSGHHDYRMYWKIWQRKDE